MTGGYLEKTGKSTSSLDGVYTEMPNPIPTPPQPIGMGERFQNKIRGLPQINIWGDLDLKTPGTRTVAILRTGLGLKGDFSGFLFTDLDHAAGAAFPDLVERILKTTDPRQLNAIRKQLMSTYIELFMKSVSFIPPLTEVPNQAKFITKAELLRLRAHPLWSRVSIETLETAISRDEEGGRILQYSAVLEEAGTSPQQLQEAYGVQNPGQFTSDIHAYRETHPNYLKRHKKERRPRVKTDTDQARQRWKELYFETTNIDSGMFNIAESLWKK
jgi:hypothetical protein